MRLAVQTQLLPDASQAASLDATVRRFNAAADWLAGIAHASPCANKYELQKRHYRELRERFDLSAQMTVRCIAVVTGALKRDRSIRPRSDQTLRCPTTHASSRAREAPFRS
jgi:putative transposase